MRRSGQGLRPSGPRPSEARGLLSGSALVGRKGRSFSRWAGLAGFSARFSCVHPSPTPHPVLARPPGFSRARPSWLSSCVAHLCTLRAPAGEEPRTCGKDVRRLFDQLLRKCEGGSRTYSPSYESETDSEASRRHNLCLCLLPYSLTKEGENLRGPALP